MSAKFKLVVFPVVLIVAAFLASLTLLPHPPTTTSVSIPMVQAPQWWKNWMEVLQYPDLATSPAQGQKRVVTRTGSVSLVLRTVSDRLGCTVFAAMFLPGKKEFQNTFLRPGPGPCTFADIGDGWQDYVKRLREWAREQKFLPWELDQIDQAIDLMEAGVQALMPK